MSINLKKGQRINLKKVDNKFDNSSQSNSSLGITEFCVGCKWGKRKRFFFFGEVDVDLDLSCLLFDENFELCDYIYSPEYTATFLSVFGYRKGKLISENSALQHSGDDREGGIEDEEQDNEIIKVDLKKLPNKVCYIVFFLNTVDERFLNLSKIPFLKIRLFEGTPENCIKEYMNFNINTDSSFANKRAIIMGTLYKENNEWNFKAIGESSSDKHICQTMDYIKKNISNLMNK